MIEYMRAEDVCTAVKVLAQLEEFSHIDPARVYCLRSRGSKARAIARIYGLPRPWVEVLGAPGYIIEVVSERFDPLSLERRIKVIIHELLHIPYTFSGALRPHGRLVNERRVDRLYRKAEKLGYVDLVRLQLQPLEA